MSTLRIDIVEVERPWDERVLKVEYGDEIVLSRNGKPVAQVVSIETPVKDAEPGPFNSNPCLGRGEVKSRGWRDGGICGLSPIILYVRHT